MQNNKIRSFLMLVFITTAFTFAQDVVQLVPYDGTPASFFNAQVIADTTANGGLLPNRVYELQRDGVYLANGDLRMSAPGEALRLRAADGAGAKPIIYLWPTGAGDNPERPRDILLEHKVVTWK